MEGTSAPGPQPGGREADMGRDRMPVTAAIRFLRRSGIPFEERPYDYVEHGGTGAYAAQAGVDEHRVIKTLIMEDDAGRPLVVLMHGDREVSTKELARFLGVRSVEPCRPETAERHSGYKVGGTSPFGLRKPMPVYIESTILELDKIFINGGRRGLLVEIAPADLERLLKPVRVSVAITR